MLAWYMSGQPIESERIMVFLLFIVTFGCVVNAVGFFFGTLNLSIGVSNFLLFLKINRKNGTKHAFFKI